MAAWPRRAPMIAQSLGHFRCKVSGLDRANELGGQKRIHNGTLKNLLDCFRGFRKRMTRKGMFQP